MADGPGQTVDHGLGVFVDVAVCAGIVVMGLSVGVQIVGMVQMGDIVRMEIIVIVFHSPYLFAVLPPVYHTSAANTTENMMKNAEIP